MDPCFKCFEKVNSMSSSDGNSSNSKKGLCSFSSVAKDICEFCWSPWGRKRCVFLHSITLTWCCAQSWIGIWSQLLYKDVFNSQTMQSSHAFCCELIRRTFPCFSQRFKFTCRQRTKNKEKKSKYLDLNKHKAV